MSRTPKETWRSINALLDDVLDLNADERDAFLNRACAEDPSMRREIDRLLKIAAEVPPFLDGPAVAYAEALLPEASGPIEPESVTDMRGRRVGAWRLTDELGRGGMGVVYRAERADGAFEQRVALKLIKRGMDSDAILERFHTERQVLASLEHPSIARLVDGGATEEGQPWFAMEYVAGVPITEYCDEHGLSIDERLMLFLNVCRAVEHAHNRLIIHRDLKPSNILVAEKGEPKLLDFGLAKVLEDPAGDPATTRPGRRWMTLDYASPEQVKGDPVGTPSDTYQLGLILYELLTGKKAYSLKDLSPTEAERVICEVAPPKPSAAWLRPADRQAVVADDAGATRVVAHVDGHPHGVPLRGPKLHKRLKGDLDTIVMKALHKDPERGYPSAETLAGDIERHLRGLPVRARPDTLGYRTKKFVGRHRWGVSVTALSALVLAAGLVGYILTLKANNARVQAEAEKAELIADYLASLFEANDPAVAQGDTITARELLARGVERAKFFEGQPRLQASLLRVTGQAHFSLGNLSKAESLFQQSLAAWEADDAPVENNEEYLQTVLERARALAWLDRYEEAEPLYRHVVGIRLDAGKEDGLLQRALFGMYYARHAMGNKEAADQAFRTWHASLSRIGSVEDTETAKRMIALGQTLGYRGQVRGNLELIRQGKVVIENARASMQVNLGRRHPLSGYALNQLVDMYLLELDMTGDTTGLLPPLDSLTNEALELHRTLYDEPNIELCHSLENRATVLSRMSRGEEATGMILEAISMAEALGGKDSEHWIAGIHKLGLISLAGGDVDNAVKWLRESLEWHQQRHGDNNLFTMNTALDLGGALARAGRYGEAETIILGTYQSLSASRGRADRYTQKAVRGLVGLYNAWGKPHQAAAYRAARIESRDANKNEETE